MSLPSGTRPSDPAISPVRRPGCLYEAFLMNKGSDVTILYRGWTQAVTAGMSLQNDLAHLELHQQRQQELAAEARGMPW